MTRTSALIGACIRLRRGQPAGDAGQITAFAVVLCVGLLCMAGLVIDGGTALGARTRALDLAQSAARAGAQELDLTQLRTTGDLRLLPDDATRAARAFLTAAGIDGADSQIRATTTTVTVTVQVSRRAQLLQLIGIRDLHAHATTSATPIAAPAPGGESP